MQQRIEKWQRWVDGPIKASIITMNHHRQIWRGLGEIIEAHGSLPDSAFWEHYFDVYAETQAMAVRRQADRHPDVASLAKLVTQVEEDYRGLTQDWWLGMWDISHHAERRRHEEAFARQQFATEFGGEIGEHLDPALPAAELERLDAASAEVTAHVDKHIAHSEDPGPHARDPGAAPAETTLTLSDVHDAIDVIGEVFQRYYALLTAASMIQLEPVIQHDWHAPFRQPWIRDD